MAAVYTSFVSLFVHQLAVWSCASWTDELRQSFLEVLITMWLSLLYNRAQLTGDIRVMCLHDLLQGSDSLVAMDFPIFVIEIWKAAHSWRLESCNEFLRGGINGTVMRNIHVAMVCVAKMCSCVLS